MSPAADREWTACGVMTVGTFILYSTEGFVCSEYSYFGVLRYDTV
jgi:hypothetical protein